MTGTQPGRPTMSRRRALVAVLGLAISAIAVWLCIQSVDLPAVGALLSQARPGPIVAFFAVLAVEIAVRGARWSVLLPRIGSGRVPTRRTLPPLMVGYLGNTVLPARLGEPVRAVLLASREGLAAAASFGSVVLERVIDTTTLALIVLPAAYLAGAPPWIVDGAALAALLAGAVLVVLSFADLDRVAQTIDARAGHVEPGAVGSLVGAIARAFRRFAEGVGASGRRQVVLVGGLLSVVAWGLDASLIWLAAWSLGVTLEPAQAVLIAGVAVLATVIPAAPGYIGTYELAATAAGVAVGIAPETALAIAVLAHALTLLAITVGGTVALLMIQRDGLEVALVAPDRPAEEPTLATREPA